MHKVVHTSSSAVFGIPRSNPVLPSTVPMPVEAYGHANLGFADKELRKFAEKAGLTLLNCETVTREKRPPHFEVISLIAKKP